MTDLDIRPGDHVTYRDRYGREWHGTALRLEPEGWRVFYRDRQRVIALGDIIAAKHSNKRRSYRQMTLELDPSARLDGPKMMGHYRTYAVYSGSGEQIGWTDGNEGDSSFAWARAYAWLKARAK